MTNKITLYRLKGEMPDKKSIDGIEEDHKLWLIEGYNAAIRIITAKLEKVDEEKLRNFLGDLMVKENMSFQMVGCGHPQDILNYVTHAICNPED